MIYLKTEVEGNLINIEIQEVEFITICPVCSKETQEELTDLVAMLDEGLDFYSTQHYCIECSNKTDGKNKHLKRIK